tara:strand:+ start:105 stop:254 length:150 start_codon:yes stop_codon:yes gene_type:complete
MSKTVWVTVAVRVRDGADIYDTINEMDYTFKHKDIIDTEVMEIDEQENE